MAEYQMDVQYLEKKFKEAKDARGRIESDWYLNLSYYMGNQWVFWNKGHIDKPRLESWRVEFVDNRIQPIVVARAAKKTASRPTFIVTPATANEDDIGDAEMGEKVLRFDWDNLNLDEKHLKAEFWSEITGAGFWKIFWDGTAGDTASFIHSNGKVLPMPGGGPMRADSPEAIIASKLLNEQGVETEAKDVSIGDIGVEVISPFEIFPDPIATSLDECEWIIEEKIRSVNYVKKHYGQTVQADAIVPTGIVESKMFNSYDAASPSGVRVYEYYCRPNTEHPNGKWVTWANKEILRETDASSSPYAKFPYVMFTSQVIPGRFWPTSVTTQLRGPQTDLNKIQSQIRENAIRIGNPPIAISKESGIKWRGKMGEAIYYNDIAQNALPVPIQMPEIPVYVREEVERIEKSISEISGIHDISQGTVPSGVTAASAINLLQEADNTRLGPEIQLMEKQLAIAGGYILELRAKYTTDKRLIRIAGNDGSWDIDEFKNDMLNSVKGVSVQAGSGMPQSKAARQAAMQELLNMALQYGVPLNQRALREFFRDYELGGFERLFQNIENDESQINRENRRMYNGEAFGINDFDDDDLHIEGHQDEMKTSKWEQKDLNTKGIFLAHWKLHKQRKKAAVDMQLNAERETAQQNFSAEQSQAEGQAESQQHRDLEQLIAKEAVKQSYTGQE